MLQQYPAPVVERVFGLLYRGTIWILQGCCEPGSCCGLGADPELETSV